jgi:hypothetical protein
MVEGQDSPSSLQEVTVNGSLENTQHSQLSVSQARDNSDECYDTEEKKKNTHTGVNTEPSFLPHWNQTGCVLQRQMFQMLQLHGEIHDLSATACSDVYTENNK